MCILRLTIVIDNITFLTKHHSKIKYNNICYTHLETVYYYYNTVLYLFILLGIFMNYGQDVLLRIYIREHLN